MQKKSVHKAGKIFFITVVSVVAAVVVALLITNIFVPVKYLFAYFTIANSNKDGEFRLSFLNVGYGDCVVAEFPDGKTLLVDGGNGSYSNNLKVLSELNSRGIDKIDYLVCTSVSAETGGGLSDILRYKDVERVFIPYCPFTYVTEEYRSFILELDKTDIEAQTLEYGVEVYDDESDFGFSVLSPSNHLLENGEISDFLNDPSEKNINNASAVIYIDYKGFGALLCGNGGTEVLDKLNTFCQTGVEINGRTIDLKNCKIITLPNHGSGASGLNTLMQSLSPRYAVLSVGENAKNLPSPSAISTAQNVVGENFFRTDFDGTITVTVKSDGTINLSKEKK